MVVQWGMSDAMGPVSFTEGHDQVFLGRDLIQHNRHSQTTAQRIDREVKNIITSCYDRAIGLLKKNREILVKLAEELIERETVDGQEVRDMVSGIGPGPAMVS